jgi:hypothetical protein
MASVPKESAPVKIVEVSGSVWLVQRGNPLSKRTPATRGATLSGNEILLTEGDSRAKLIIGNQEAALLVKKESQLTIEKTKEDLWRINLDHGMLLSYVKPKPNSIRSHFQVKTPTAVMGVRGTVFFVRSEPKKALFLCTCSGVVAVDNQVILIGKNHDTPKLIRSGSEPLFQRMLQTQQGEDHTNTESDELKNLLDPVLLGHEL